MSFSKDLTSTISIYASLVWKKTTHWHRRVSERRTQMDHCPSQKRHRRRDIQVQARLKIGPLRLSLVLLQSSLPRYSSWLSSLPPLQRVDLYQMVMIQLNTHELKRVYCLVNGDVRCPDRSHLPFLHQLYCNIGRSCIHSSNKSTLFINRVECYTSLLVNHV